MSTLYKSGLGLCVAILLIGIGAVGVNAQSSGSSIDLNTASTAELQGVLSDLQQQVNNLSAQVSSQQSGTEDQVSDQGNEGGGSAGDSTGADDNTAGENPSGEGAGSGDGRSGGSDGSRSGGEAGERPINFELDSLLDVGSQGQQVRWVQQLLAQHPDIYPEGLVTGYYGNLTSQAVSRLQRQAGLPAVGRVGQQTLDYLQEISDPVGADNGNDDGRADRGRSVTLSDTFNNFDFTAEITQINDTTWSYDVEGNVPNSGYGISASTNGPSLFVSVNQEDQVGRDVITDVSQTGTMNVEPDTPLSAATFTVVGRESGGDNGGSDDGNQCGSVAIRSGQSEVLEFGNDEVEIEYSGQSSAGYVTTLGDTRTTFDSEGDVVDYEGEAFELTDVTEVDPSTQRVDPFSVIVITHDCQETNEDDDDDDTGGSDDGDDLSDRYDDQLILERTVGGIQEFPVTIGDVNEDGDVTPDDASLLADYINNEANLDSQQRAAADVNGDGRIDGRDANKITEEVNDPTSAPRFPVMIGDVDGNLSINTGDAGLVQDYVRGEADLSSQQLAAADVNGDGEVTANVDQPGDDDSGGEQVTLRDNFRDTFEFTATVSQVDDSTWQYEVVGSVPSPNYSMSVTTDGPLIVAQIERGTGAAPQVVSEVGERGRFSVDSDTEAEDIQFEVRGDSESGEAENPTARLELTGQDRPIQVGEKVRFRAGESSDPQGDELEYQWSVETSRGSSGGTFGR